MTQETAITRIRNAVNEACKGESEFVKDYFFDITLKTFNTLENDKHDRHASWENLNYAIAINLEDDYSNLLEEAHEIEQKRKAEEEERQKERQYLIGCAKKEIAFYNALLIDWKCYHKALFDKIVEWFKSRGLEANEDTYEEYNTINKKHEKEHRRQIDFLGSFCGFTLQEINGETEIGYIWTFTDDYSEELYIDDKGEVQLWQR